MSDPYNFDVIADIQFALGCTIKPLLALESEITAFIRQYYQMAILCIANPPQERCQINLN